MVSDSLVGRSTAWTLGDEQEPSLRVEDVDSHPGRCVTRSVLGARYLLNACQDYLKLSDCLFHHHCFRQGCLIKKILVITQLEVHVNKSKKIH